MTALQLAELNGLLALAIERRKQSGDERETEEIADDLLRESLADRLMVEGLLGRLGRLAGMA